MDRAALISDLIADGKYDYTFLVITFENSDQ